MIAFHGKKEIKKTYVNRVLAHQKADEIIKGQYWKEGKGCAVGCTLHSHNHSAYETKLGIPKWLAYVEDSLFEGMSKKRAKLFPVQFLKAINVGADLEKIKAPFMIFILQSALKTFDHAKFTDCKKAVDTVISLYESGETDLGKFFTAAYIADTARVARVAAINATCIGYAPYADSDPAAYAAYAASYAAYAAAPAAPNAVNTNTASYAVVSSAASYIVTHVAASRTAIINGKFGDKLLKLMKGCK